MYLERHKLMIVTLLLVFFGQVIAATTQSYFECIQNQIVMEDHSNHMNVDQSRDSNSSKAERNCLQENSCPMSTCLSVTLLNQIIDKDILFAVQNIVVQPIKLKINQISRSIYRPPILS